MNKRLLLGLGRRLLPIPRSIWQRHVAQGEPGGHSSLSFMTEEHHRVRDFAVIELPRAGVPLSPGLIAQRLHLSVERVNVILDELEKHLTFVFRNTQGRGCVGLSGHGGPHAPSHHVQHRRANLRGLSGAQRAIATPFVQGQLRKVRLSFAVETECAHCARPIHIEMDSDLNYFVAEKEADPLILASVVDFGKLQDPSIIDAF